MPTATRNMTAKLIAISIVTLATSMVSQEASAQEDSAIFGTYHYTKSYAHGRSVVLGAFKRSLTSMSSIFRPLVMGRIERSDIMVSTFDISRTADGVVFRAVAPTPWTWDLTPGVPEQVDTPTGGRAKMVHRVTGRTYVQTFNNRTTNQQMVYRLTPEGNRMWVDTRVRFSFLDEPVVFSLYYRRVGT